MRIDILFGERKGKYDGQYGPEALEVFDEYSEEDNSDWLTGKQAEYNKSGEFAALAIVSFEINDAAIKNRLYPKEKLIAARMVEES